MHFGRVDDFGRRQVDFERPGILVVVGGGGCRRVGVRRGLARRRTFGPRADVTVHAREIAQHARRARRTVPLARELVVEQPELHDVVNRVDGALSGLICEPSRDSHPARVRPQLCGARRGRGRAARERAAARARSPIAPERVALEGLRHEHLRRAKHAPPARVGIVFVRAHRREVAAVGEPHDRTRVEPPPRVLHGGGEVVSLSEKEARLAHFCLAPRRRTDTPGRTELIQILCDLL